MYPHCKYTILKIRNKYYQKRNCASSVPQFLHSCVCKRFIYSHNWSAYSAVGKYVDQSWESLTNMIIEIGTKVAQFLFWEYINGIFAAVQPKLIWQSLSLGTVPLTTSPYDRMREGMMGGQFWSAFISCNSQFKDAVQKFIEQIDVIRLIVKK
jgi:hypothetical protein